MTRPAPDAVMNVYIQGSGATVTTEKHGEGARYDSTAWSNVYIEERFFFHVCSLVLRNAPFVILPMM